MSHNLIIDRAIEDYQHFQDLRQAMIKNTATPEERQEWLQEMRGRYGFQTINRVGEEMIRITEPLPILPRPKTDFTYRDFADEYAQAHFDHYLAELQLTRDVFQSVVIGVTLPELPTSLNNLTLEEANDIERMLWIIWDIYEHHGITYFNSAHPLAFSGNNRYFLETPEENIQPLPPMPVIMPSNLNHAIAGLAYHDIILVWDVIIDIELPLNVEIISGRLPTGITITHSRINEVFVQIIIGGITVETGSFPFTIQVSNTLTDLFNVQVTGNFTLYVMTSPVHFYSGEPFAVSGSEAFMADPII